MATMNVRVRLLDGHVALGQQEDGQVILLDRPVETGGTGLGFNGGHLMLLGWGACFKSTLLAAADARGIRVERLELEISGETVQTPYRFETLHMRIRLKADCDENDKRKLIEIAKKGCAVSNTLSRGVTLDVGTD